MVKLKRGDFVAYCCSCQSIDIIALVEDDLACHVSIETKGDSNCIFKFGKKKFEFGDAI